MKGTQFEKPHLEKIQNSIAVNMVEKISFTFIYVPTVNTWYLIMCINKLVFFCLTSSSLILRLTTIFTARCDNKSTS